MGAFGGRPLLSFARGGQLRPKPPSSVQLSSAPIPMHVPLQTENIDAKNEREKNSRLPTVVKDLAPHDPRRIPVVTRDVSGSAGDFLTSRSTTASSSSAGTNASVRKDLGSSITASSSSASKIHELKRLLRKE